MTNTIAINQQPLEGQSIAAGEHAVQSQVAPAGDRLILPNFFWAAVIFAALNVLLLMWFTISPKLSRGAANAAELLTVSSTDKPSPFTPVVDERKHTRRTAEKVRPVVVASTLESLDAGTTSWQSVSMQDEQSLSMNHQKVDAAYVRGNDVYEMLDRKSEMPRLTASAYPRSAEQPRPAASSPIVP
jgi:hypothetical protein